MRIHLVGASGSGVTTLGEALAARLSIPYFDADAYYWLPTQPPFQVRHDPTVRNQLLKTDLNQHPNWIVGGSLDSWGSYWETLFDLVVYLWIPADIRIQRLWQREIDRYGFGAQQNAEQRQRSEAFIEWAAGYDSGLQQGRSKPRHESWLQQLSCPVLRLEGDLTVEERITAVLGAIDQP
ncbi:adenylate kinase [Spirosoma sp. SC4-14]|uniref:adenylate kinase n=1 Tax=Spirosoma sp. SC4-14 TaxID=3128900 RepID=UPI0030D1AE54